ncbi:BTAD domain-containing putative transcriptional regulator [Actinoplanes sp. NPDC089786]|uniref:AfsR/SARP family transcriptional regulator n=1 Tax=Actinoplanes sp. NPDC089786 TaxID=3155185 RepID=UPI00344802E6
MLFRILGPIELHTPAAVHQLGAGKPATVLATLLQQPNAWVTVDQLAEATWPGAAMPASASANLKTYVWQLRRLLPDLDGAGRIDRRADAYRLRVAPGEVDADRARSLGASALAAPPPARLPLLREALSLWRGRPYCGVEPAASAALALTELRLELSEQLAEVQLELGDHTNAVGTLREVTSEAPLREPAWALLVRALTAAGQRTEALLAARRAAEILRSELGVTPGPVLAAASHSLAPPLTDVSPRRELPRDVRLIGRAPEIAHIRRAATAPAPLVLLTGPPGIGKTALAVHAAHQLAPNFPDGQFFVHMRQPAGALLDRLLRGLGLSLLRIPPDLDERASLWRSSVAGRRILLVLDDALTRDQVWPLLPATPGSLTLVTARSLAGHLDGATRIPLHPLSPTAAKSLYAAASATHPNPAGIAAGRGNPGALLLAATAPAMQRRAAV